MVLNPLGIADENLNRVFDPFYSSKSVNKGNGIGLANVFSTMYKHNGHIQLEGHGALGGAHFTLIFKCKVIQKKTPSLLPSKSKLNMQGKRVLVLDDEISIAEFVALYLESEGVIAQHTDNKIDLIKIFANSSTTSSKQIILSFLIFFRLTIASS